MGAATSQKHLAEKTRKEHTLYIKRYILFSELARRSPSDMTESLPRHIRAFLQDICNGGTHSRLPGMAGSRRGKQANNTSRTPATSRNARAAVSYYFKQRGANGKWTHQGGAVYTGNPTLSDVIREFMSGFKKDRIKAGWTEKQKRAIMRSHMMRLGEYNLAKLNEARDCGDQGAVKRILQAQAKYVLAFKLLLCVSEVQRLRTGMFTWNCSIQIRDEGLSTEGTVHDTVQLPWLKTHQEGKCGKIPLYSEHKKDWQVCPHAWLSMYLKEVMPEVTRDSDVLLFPELDEDGDIRMPPREMSYERFKHQFHSDLVGAGVCTKEEAKAFGTHCFR
eukprot:Opistho-2@76513